METISRMTGATERKKKHLAFKETREEKRIEEKDGHRSALDWEKSDRQTTRRRFMF